MATREENLKKINEQLEKLSDKELDQVAGGNVEDTAYDSRFLYERGLMDDWHGVTATDLHWISYSAAVDEGWRKAGITCVTVRGDNEYGSIESNRYYLNGQQISRDEAWKFVAERFQRIRDCD